MRNEEWMRKSLRISLIEWDKGTVLLSQLLPAHVWDVGHR